MDPQYGIQGLSLPNGKTNIEQLFADDINLYVQENPHNLDKVMHVLNLFCNGSGSRINWKKTYLLWASKREQNWTWEEELGVNWFKKGEWVRYLGVSYGYKVLQEIKNEKILTQVRKALIYWSSRKLSQADKILVSNQVILASLWYLASSTDIAYKFLKKAKRMVQDYLWSGRGDGRARTK